MKKKRRNRKNISQKKVEIRNRKHVRWKLFSEWMGFIEHFHIRSKLEGPISDLKIPVWIKVPFTERIAHNNVKCVL